MLVQFLDDVIVGDADGAATAAGWRARTARETAMYGPAVTEAMPRWHPIVRSSPVMALTPSNTDIDLVRSSSLFAPVLLVPATDGGRDDFAGPVVADATLTVGKFARTGADVPADRPLCFVIQHVL
jgi:hypothetical protein